MSARKKTSDFVGIIACILLALLSLGMGLAISKQVQSLESAGIRADAIVTGIEHGAKNSKFAVVSFKTADLVKVETKCALQMFVIRHKIGDRVTVLYDPEEPATAMIDNGLWNWDQPAFALFGSLVLLGLALVFSVSRNKTGSNT